MADASNEMEDNEVVEEGVEGKEATIVTGQTEEKNKAATEAKQVVTRWQAWKDKFLPKKSNGFPQRQEMLLF